MTPEQRRLRAQLAAHESWARTPDPASRTAKARAAAEGRWEAKARELHPDGDAELIVRVAAHLKRAHFARMALASAKARRKAAA
jgi:hypothetical protein